MDDLVVGGIPLIAVVFGLVEFSKRFGLAGNWLTLLSMVLGVVFGVSFQLTQMYPEFARWFGVAVFSLAVGLSASGLYDFSKRLMPRNDA